MAPFRKGAKVKIRYSGREPRKAHESDAAYDLKAQITLPRTINPGESVTFPLGFRVSIPDGYVGLVVPRSGLAFKHGITLLNSPGVIDPGYVGEVMARLVNHGNAPYMVTPYDRIAQLLVVKCAEVEFEHSDDIASDETERGDGGFGSTGR